MDDLTERCHPRRDCEAISGRGSILKALKEKMDSLPAACGGAGNDRIPNVAYESLIPGTGIILKVT